MVVNVHGTYAHGSAGKQDVSSFQSYVLRHVRYQSVNGENHIVAIAFLHFLVIEQKVEIKVLNVSELAFREKCPDNG